jgi:hypothetical protein
MPECTHLLFSGIAASLYQYAAASTFRTLFCLEYTASSNTSGTNQDQFVLGDVY